MLFSILTLLAASQALGAPSPPLSPLQSRLAGPVAYVTTSDLSHKLSAAAAPVRGPGTGGSSTWDLSIDDTASGHKQTIIGFGVGLGDGCHGDGHERAPCRQAEPAHQRAPHIRRRRLQLPAPHHRELGFVGPAAYTYDDAGGNADPNLVNFNLGDRGTAMAKMLATFRSVKSGLTILGSPWSAPGWMKLNRVSPCYAM
ncbi:hypothetical protein O1611_g3304 [Lasiodiplodia mahajangana]|uniref:Uncharacterized protein n=1 Tax=Lasiodiplodia mahajangana TaxID=1108764 RepID=A0ACC2JS53_9PEZI|nr:hypothetical protein O1611_g3304 [Lasiodiplodia mahajangana]